MHPLLRSIHQNRRDFLTSTASGIGLLALASLFRDNGLLAAEASVSANPLTPQAPQFAPKAKVEQLMAWVADWVARGGKSLGKPTHLEARDGRS
jgi:hypothetical protein